MVHLRGGRSRTTPRRGKLDALHQAIDDLAHGDAFSMADADSIIELNRLSARLEGVRTAALAEFDAGGEWAPDGAKTATAWLATRCHLPKAEAARSLRRGRLLPHLPVAAAAFREGAIGAAQFDALAKVRTPVTEAVFARDEAYLVGQAKELKFEALVAVLAYWLQHADPDGADEADMERRARRDVYLTTSLHGMVLGAMTLDPIGGSIVADELFRLEQVCSLRVLRPPGREVPDRPHRALERGWADHPGERTGPLRLP
jgi:hypothetical protein